MLSKMSAKNSVLIYDRKTRCREVACRPGMLVQDVIHQACRNLDPPITPIGRYFFGLKTMKTHCYLSPYQPVPAGGHRYQLRVFVSPAQNAFHFQSVSRSLLNYYYYQLKEDFVHDWLYPPVSVNNAIWMVAADLAKEAIEKSKDFKDFSQPEIWRLSSPSLKDKWKEDSSVGEMLETTFRKFLEAYHKCQSAGAAGEREAEHFPDHFHCRYVEIYEQDEHCGTHLFQLKQQSHFSPTPFSRRSREAVVILAVSPRKGLYTFTFKGKKKQTDNQELCRIVDIANLVLDDHGLVATIECSQPSKTHKLHFKSKEELMSFFAVLDAYYRLKVDANSTVLKLNKDRVVVEGVLTPTPNFDSLPNTDLYYAPICQEAVKRVLTKFDCPEGYFLIRQSRSHENSFVLSLCHNKRVLNFRLIEHQDGSLSLFNPRQEDGQSCEPAFPSLHNLIESHKVKRDGLPILLTQNCAPNVPGDIPLVPSDKDDDTLDTGSHTISASVSMSSEISPSPEQPSPLPGHIQQLIQDGVQYINYESINLEGELGSGHFSTVYRGEWNNKKVAVKVPSGLSTTTADLVMRDLTREIQMMARLDHPNVVRLYGITHTRHYLNCLKTVMMVVMEFVQGGSLSSHLEKLKRTQVPHDSIMRDNKLKFVEFSCQIAEAMEYFEQQGVVHRDLATRNVLVVSETHVKVSDFGLARQFKDDKTYYPGSNNKDVPIFWFAPECLQAPRKFSNKSDVWSYGVTLWEIFSLGDNPRYYLQPHLTKSGDPFNSLHEYYKTPTHRLPAKPPVPADVYSLLQKCWSFLPADRPSFKDIKDQISQLSALY